MTSIQAAQWATLLAILALAFLATGAALPNRAVTAAAAVTAWVAVILYAIALAN